MFKKMMQFFLRLFSRKPQVDAEAQPAATLPVISDRESGSIRRIRLLCNELKPYRRRMPQVKVLYVKGFPDVQRFLIRLCGQRTWKFRYIASRLYGHAELPHGEGYMTLEEKRSVADREVVAILSVHVPRLANIVGEVRFKLKQNS